MVWFSNFVPCSTSSLSTLGLCCRSVAVRSSAMNIQTSNHILLRHFLLSVALYLL